MQNITPSPLPTTRTAIVTGGASGIGLAIVEKFIQENIKTIVIGRDEQKLQATRERFGPLCITEAFDLNHLAGIPALVERLAQEHGQLDILVNNAGVNMKKPLVEVTDEDFQRILLTNVSAVFSLSREVVKVMLPYGEGAIVNISSMASQYGIPKVIAYTASKSAIEGMTRAMATELSPLGLRINCVAPGFIATAMSAKAMDSDPERKNKALGRTPMGKFGTPADVADSVYFFATEGARYVTGTVLPVDGGNSIGF
ncbi:SDR family NAD(P)-dependent oxidoreductase [Rufibacter glacialis]|uniref:SDR family NAD(P)-dependent oxidoreductase n=1 Tax=Rufibacter glacialis TaxID=1259555 RepID=A0A5M8QC02_9BACT|nr:SDR family oxidoreductase [Rufibacter glacialis]KAA6432484.1 SDR family oxidoreductase [Rufibacter glacialis]GGK79059.1 3-oxoacyl-ACP reductase [Rufibacter glacialis]